MQTAYAAAMEQPGPTTRPGGPMRAFMSNASTLAPAPGRRSPFGEFKASPARGEHAPEPRPAMPGVWARAASAPRSRSPHAAPPAPESTVAEIARKLQLQIDNLEKQRADDRKRLIESAQRIDAMEAQARAQTREAMEYARAKCVDVDGRMRDIDVRLRAELDDNISKLLSGLEAKMAGSIPVTAETHIKVLEKSLEAKVKERIHGVDQTIKGFDQTVRTQ